MATDTITIRFRLTWWPPVLRRALDRSVVWLWWPAIFARAALGVLRRR